MTLQDIDKRLGDRLYELRSAVLTEILLELQPKLSAGDSVPHDDAKESDEATIRRAYEGAKSRGAIPPGTSLDEARPMLAELVERQIHRERNTRALTELLHSGKVAISLANIGRPRLALREIAPMDSRPKAIVTIHEYTDFESPFARMANETVRRVREEYPTQVRFVYHQNPQPEHPHAKNAGIAAICASQQNQYWRYREELFRNQGSLNGVEQLVALAQKIQLDVASFTKCLAAPEQLAAVERDIKEAKDNDLSGEPVFSVNGTRLSGAHEFQTFQQLIEIELSWVKEK